MNTSGITPMEFNVLVKPTDVEEKTKGGVLLPDEVKDKDAFGRTEGTLVAVSPVSFTYAEFPSDARKPMVGDHVLFSKYQAVEVTGKDAGQYWLMKDTAIAAVME